MRGLTRVRHGCLGRRSPTAAATPKPLPTLVGHAPPAHATDSNASPCCVCYLYYHSDGALLAEDPARLSHGALDCLSCLPVGRERGPLWLWLWKSAQKGNWHVSIESDVQPHKSCHASVHTAYAVGVLAGTVQNPPPATAHAIPAQPDPQQLCCTPVPARHRSRSQPCE